MSQRRWEIWLTPAACRLRCSSPWGRRRPGCRGRPCARAAGLAALGGGDGARRCGVRVLSLPPVTVGCRSRAPPAVAPGPPPGNGAVGSVGFAVGRLRRVPVPPPRAGGWECAAGRGLGARRGACVLRPAVRRPPGGPCPRLRGRRPSAPFGPPPPDGAHGPSFPVRPPGRAGSGAPSWASSSRVGPAVLEISSPRSARVSRPLG